LNPSFDVVSFIPMEHNACRVSSSALVRALLLILILLAVPLVLSNNSAGSVSAILLLAIVFIFPGYLFLNLLGEPPSGLRILLSPVFGIVTITTAYDIFSLGAQGAYFPYCVVALAAAGIICFALQARRAAPLSRCTQSEYESLRAGVWWRCALLPSFGEAAASLMVNLYSTALPGGINCST